MVPSVPCTLLCAGVIHGDFNEQNVLVRRDQQRSSAGVTVVAVIDFGDSEVAPYIFDVAIAAVYCMLQSAQVTTRLLAFLLLARRRVLYNQQSVPNLIKIGQTVAET